MLKLNNIYLGNCFDVLSKIDNDSVDLIIIDPPYKFKKDIINNEFSKSLFRILKDTGNLYIWCTIGQTAQSLINWFPIFDKIFYFKDLVTWKKQRGMGNKKGWLHVNEEIMWFVKNNKEFTWNKKEQYNWNSKRAYNTGLNQNDYHRWTNIWIDIIEINQTTAKNAELSLHPHQKPQKALKRIIQLHTKENDIVLDCFAGSGSTGLAAKETNRNFILIEKEKHYCNVCCHRIGLKTIIGSNTDV